VGNKGVESYRKNIKGRKGAFSRRRTVQKKGALVYDLRGLYKEIQSRSQFPGVGAVVSGAHRKAQYGGMAAYLFPALVQAAHNFPACAVSAGGNDKVKGPFPKILPAWFSPRKAFFNYSGGNSSGMSSFSGGDKAPDTAFPGGCFRRA
jgi:hypothetical protein